MKVSVVNLGCKVNRVESDTIALSYESNGNTLCQVPDADLVVVNTCTVTEEADKKTRKSIRRVLRQNPTAKVVVTGCAAAIDPEFFEQLSERVCVCDKVDLLDGGEAGSAKSSSLVRVGEEFPTRVSLKVQDGCNHSCTYCIVHVARGRAWSKPSQEIVAEALALARAGVKELVLTGIDLGSYCYESDGVRIRLASLVQLLLDGLESAGYADVRLRIGSVEPCSLSEDFIQVMAGSHGRVCRHLHLPLQSGSSKVLKEMNRPYSAEKFIEIAENLKNKVPGISLTTDIIVGFPGETDDDFVETCQLARKVGFSKIHVFRYSKRKGTPAAQRADQVSSELKEQRAHALIALGEELRVAFAKSQLGKLECIAVEQEGMGMTESYFKVRLGDAHVPGSIVEAELVNLDESAGVFSA